MIRFNILTLFPEMFHSYLAVGLIRKSLDNGLIQVNLRNFREYGLGKHLAVDDTPYGGGAGMVLRLEPIVKALEAVEQESREGKTLRLLITPQGETFTQKKALALSKVDVPITLVCGKYEGFDERIRHYIDEEISIGDYILQGGEIAAMAVVEAVSRLVPGVIGNRESLEHESFNTDLLEYAQYTKPPEFNGLKVPKVLLSGNHEKIKAWRENNAIQKTKNRRPDLYERHKTQC